MGSPHQNMVMERNLEYRERKEQKRKKWGRVSKEEGWRDSEESWGILWNLGVLILSSLLALWPLDVRCRVREKRKGRGEGRKFGSRGVRDGL